MKKRLAKWLIMLYCGFPGLIATIAFAAAFYFILGLHDVAKAVSLMQLGLILMFSRCLIVLTLVANGRISFVKKLAKIATEEF